MSPITASIVAALVTSTPGIVISRRISGEASASGSSTSPSQLRPRLPKRSLTGAFAGYWGGHDRGLSISRSGLASEEWLSSCCNVVIGLRFQLSNPHGTSQRATAIATVSFVRVRDKTYFTKADPPPHVGERRTVRLNSHVITEPLVGATYCGRGAAARACGA